MAVRLLKGQKINGVDYPAFDVLVGLGADAEARLKQGGDAAQVNVVVLSDIAAAAVQAMRTEAVQRPYRWACFGDSRSHGIGATNILAVTGTANDLSSFRSISWVVGFMGDSEFVADFGISGDNASNWANPARPYGKTINALVGAAGFKGGPVDACYVQYGVNDIFAGVAAPTIAANLQGLCSALMGAGIKVVFEAINPCSAANYGANAATKLQVSIDVNTAMKSWLSGYPKQAVFVDTWSQFVDATGYANPTYSDGTHWANAAGAAMSGQACAVAARAILPQRFGQVYTSGSLLQPNLVDLSINPYAFTSPDVGNFSVVGPVAQPASASDVGLPFYELTATCTALAGGMALLRWEIPASLCAQAGARFPLAIGDEVQGSAYIVMDDGAGGVAPIQCCALRQRIYGDKYVGDGVTNGSALLNIPVKVARRFCTPTFISGVASATVPAPAISTGYTLVVFVEVNTVGAKVRIRVYSPSARVVSSPQPAAITPPASGTAFTNTYGAAGTLYVAGGTISQITISRQGAQVVTGQVAGGFRLAQNDTLTMTYTVAPTGFNFVLDEPAKQSVVA